MAVKPRKHLDTSSPFRPAFPSSLRSGCLLLYQFPRVRLVFGKFIRKRLDFSRSVWYCHSHPGKRSSSCCSAWSSHSFKANREVRSPHSRKSILPASSHSATLVSLAQLRLQGLVTLLLGGIPCPWIVVFTSPLTCSPRAPFLGALLPRRPPLSASWRVDGCRPGLVPWPCWTQCTRASVPRPGCPSTHRPASTGPPAAAFWLLMGRFLFWLASSSLSG
jgi:hypothetical protein